MIGLSGQRVDAPHGQRVGSTVVEVPGSHAIYVSQPAAVAALIQKAVEGVTAAAT